ncbi:MAG: hypothetical protein RIR62_64 [Pseudomonadota bacterium]|jgi:hypothetical protein
MEGLATGVTTILAQSGAMRALVVAVPVAITVSFLAGWRARVENTLPAAIWGGLLCLWIAAPVRFGLIEMNQLRWMVAILGWFWLVSAWVRHVLGEWPEPIWGHWIVGTLLLLLPIVAGVEAVRLL